LRQYHHFTVVADTEKVLNKKIISRVIFYALATLLLIALGWLAGWLIKGRNLPMEEQKDYFADPFRIVFIGYVLLEGISDFLFSPRWRRPKDEVSHDWHHTWERMWETTLVISVFSDYMGILPMSMTQTTRLIGALLLGFALILNSVTGLNRRKYLAGNREEPFPTKGIFGVLRFPDHLVSLFTVFGISMVFNAWAGFFCAFIALFTLVGYVKNQDKLLLSKFESVWADYQQKVKRLIPKVW
jgi:protein-S-isoprenylcysteine O-methyltransferase Ste14